MKSLSLFLVRTGHYFLLNLLGYPASTLPAYTTATQYGLYSIVFPGNPTVQAPRWQHTESGKLVDAGMQQLEMLDADKANSTYTVMFGPADTTPALLHQRVATDAARLDRAYDNAFHSDGTIIYARLATLPEFAPTPILCQEILWRDKTGNFACFRTFYHRHMAIRATVTATRQTFNQVEADKFLRSFKPL